MTMIAHQTHGSVCLKDTKYARKTHGHVCLKVSLWRTLCQENTWSCLFEGHSMCQEDTRSCPQTRIASLLTLCLRGQVHFLQPFWIWKLKIFCLFRMWLRINMVIGFRIAAGGWWLEEVKPKLKTATSQPTSKKTSPMISAPSQNSAPTNNHPSLFFFLPVTVQKCSRWWIGRILDPADETDPEQIFADGSSLEFILTTDPKRHFYWIGNL